MYALLTNGYAPCFPEFAPGYVADYPHFGGLFSRRGQPADIVADRGMLGNRGGENGLHVAGGGCILVTCRAPDSGGALMRLVNRSLIAGIVLSLIPTTAVHATANLRMSLDQFGYYSCDLADPGPGGVVLAYVFLTSHPGAHSVRFAAPVPPASGYSYIGNSPSIGDPENGFVLSVGDCETGPELIMTMLLVRTSAGSPCSMWRIAPYPGDSQVVYTDCQGLQQVATHGTGIALNSNGNCEHGTPPYNPIPPAGAIGVPKRSSMAA